jgi:hypothetical protein
VPEELGDLLPQPDRLGQERAVGLDRPVPVLAEEALAE